MAGAQVVGIFELLEQILLDLANDQESADDSKGLLTLFTAQRVCRTFRDTISGSERIQKALFLTPPLPHKSKGPPVRSNPLLPKLHSSKYEHLFNQVSPPRFTRRSQVRTLSLREAVKSWSLDRSTKSASSYWKMYLYNREYIVDKMEIVDLETDGSFSREYAAKLEEWAKPRSQILRNPTMGQLNERMGIPKDMTFCDMLRDMVVESIPSLCIMVLVHLYLAYSQNGRTDVNIGRDGVDQGPYFWNPWERLVSSRLGREM